MKCGVADDVGFAVEVMACNFDLFRIRTILGTNYIGELGDVAPSSFSNSASNVNEALSWLLMSLAILFILASSRLCFVHGIGNFSTPSFTSLLCNWEFLTLKRPLSSLRSFLRNELPKLVSFDSLAVAHYWIDCVDSLPFCNALLPLYVRLLSSRKCIILDWRSLSFSALLSLELLTYLVDSLVSSSLLFLLECIILLDGWSALDPLLKGDYALSWIFTNVYTWNWFLLGPWWWEMSLLSFEPDLISMVRPPVSRLVLTWFLWELGFDIYPDIILIEASLMSFLWASLI